MIGAWANFAKTGNPGRVDGVKWEKAFIDKTNQVTRYLNLNVNNYTMVDGNYNEKCQFYKSQI